jgi:hypothetical protein
MAETKIRAEVTAIETLDPIVVGGPRRYAVTVQAISSRDSTCLNLETTERPEIDAPVTITVDIAAAGDTQGDPAASPTGETRGDAATKER